MRVLTCAETAPGTGDHCQAKIVTAEPAALLTSLNEERQVKEPASRLGTAGRSAHGHFLPVIILTLEAAAAGAPSALTPTVKVVSVVLPEASVHATLKV